MTSDFVSRLREGGACWRSGTIDRAAFLVDGRAYFRTLASALPHATETVWIIGWDFDPRINLSGDDAEFLRLGPMLRSLVEERPQLKVRILIWSLGPLYSSHSTRLYHLQHWADHPRIHLRFDSRHPLRGAHHQKIVCLDGTTAFVGGIDLTGGRWDRRTHESTSQERHGPDGEPYGTVHDVQLLFTGELARSIGDLCAERWYRATRERVPPGRGRAPWPPEMQPDLADCDGAIARTQPGGLFRRQRREALRLTQELVSAARNSIYLETQYFASFRIGGLLARRLAEEAGPEVVIVVTKSSRGIFEQFVMAHNRDRLIRRLRRADHHRRLRVAYAVTPGPDGADVEVLIHSKVIVVDDRLVRIGSSNLNNRSEGLDSECDVVVSAGDERQRLAVARFRDGLLAEHMGRKPSEVRETVAETGSLVAAIDRLNTNAKRLCEYPARSTRRGSDQPVAGTGLLDPRKTFWPIQRIGVFLRNAIVSLRQRCSRRG